MTMMASTPLFQAGSPSEWQIMCCAADHPSVVLKDRDSHMQQEYLDEQKQTKSNRKQSADLSVVPAQLLYVLAHQLIWHATPQSAVLDHQRKLFFSDIARERFPIIFFLYHARDFRLFFSSPSSYILLKKNDNFHDCTLSEIG